MPPSPERALLVPELGETNVRRGLIAMNAYPVQKAEMNPEGLGQPLISLR
jgi:hypothetical protein